MDRTNPITVVVNATAARESGALTILRQFLAALDRNIGDHRYVIFIPEGLGFVSDGNKRFVELGKQGWRGRIDWDGRGFRAWLNKENVRPDAIVSLQNTGVNYDKNVPQIIYYHQSLPLEKFRWNPFNSSQRLYFLYKRFYPFFVRRYLGLASMVIVQREGIRDAFAQRFGFNKDKIVVLRPDMPNIDHEDVRNILFDDGNIHLIYASRPMIYKNHAVLVGACEILKSTGKAARLRIHLTCNKDADIPFVRAIVDKGLEDMFIFEGKVSFSEALSFYKSCNALVFPSYIETYGLPLAEAASFGTPVICSDLSYSREVLAGYDGATYVKYNDTVDWANAIEGLIDRPDERYHPLQLEGRSDWDLLFELCAEVVKNK